MKVKSTIILIVTLILVIVVVYLSSRNVGRIWTDTQQLQEQLIQRLLKVDPGLLAEHASLVAAQNSGIARVLERNNFDGQGAYFSFTSLQHDYQQYPDLSLEQGRLDSGFYGGNFGLFHNLGDVPIDAVSIDDLPGDWGNMSADEFAKLRDNFPHIRPHYRPLAQPDMTYLLRSLQYEDSDLIVAFRIVQQDRSGITFLWRILKRFPPTPHPSRR